MSWNLMGAEEEKSYDDVWKTPDKIVKKTGLKVLVWGPPEWW